MILDKMLLDEIDEKAVYLARDHASSDLTRLVRRSLEEEALAHSRLLEENVHTRREERERKKTYAETAVSLKDAWDYGRKNLTTLAHDVVKEIGRRVDQKADRYRDTAVMISGDEIAQGVNPGKIERDLDMLFSHVNRDDVHAVERAALLHFHFARIHPFADGNGRTARLLQNLLLHNNCYSPVIIEPGEKSFYIDLLAAARKGYIQRESKGKFEDAWAEPLAASQEEGQFFHYVGTKVNMSLDRLIGTLGKYPTHHVELDKGAPGRIMTVKHVLQNYFRAEQRPGQVRIKGNGHDTLEIRGDISRVQLGNILENVKCIKGEYRVK